ncbi:MAG: pyridoxamine 5'-phosphate oxidase family protein [Promethearchaeota archaeon]
MPNEFLLSNSENEFLTKSRVARIATIDAASNFPHIIPICYSFDGNNFFTSLRNTSKRLQNINKGSKVSLLFDEYVENNGKWITLRGILINVTISILNYHDHSEQFKQGWKQLIEKYHQYKTWAQEDLSPTDSNTRRIMKMTPIHKISWGF